jgi:thiol-disulfide isomerase/thioredoxin
VLDFWGVHCAPCLASLPEMEALHQKYGEATFIGVCDPHDGQLAGARLKEKGVTYANALDTGDKDEVPQSHLLYGYKGIPHIIVIGKDGKIVLDTDDPDALKETLKGLFGS